MSTLPDLKISPERLMESLAALGQVGALAGGGVNRLALSDADRLGRDWTVARMHALGMAVTVDAIGNVFAVYAGTEDLAPVMTGSHIDTVRTGGLYDGNYGVLAGLEVLRTLNDAGLRTVAPLEVCVWTNEEGSRFVPVMMGSGVYAGAFTLASALEATDRDGIRVDQALQAIGFAGDAPAAVDQGAPRFGAYFEAHIEQGPVLEDADVPLGVVTGALGQRWYDVVVTGQEAHAGPTPMALRRDALQGATGLMQAVRRIALDEQPDGRGTVGYVQV
ncbi:MAG: hydantoinase/carbamoylase family amidase, partial [Polaromonas sp.]|nr:hydantoinase/carbamoylase family amidase [Polaromonas sp.]